MIRHRKGTLGSGSGEAATGGTKPAGGGHAASAAIGTRGTSVQDAAFMAGYVDMKAFRRAFRRWTGESPQTYRRTQRGG